MHASVGGGACGCIQPCSSCPRPFCEPRRHELLARSLLIAILLIILPSVLKHSGGLEDAKKAIQLVFFLQASLFEKQHRVGGGQDDSTARGGQEFKDSGFSFVPGSMASASELSELSKKMARLSTRPASPSLKDDVLQASPTLLCRLAVLWPCCLSYPQKSDSCSSLQGSHKEATTSSAEKDASSQCNLSSSTPQLPPHPPRIIKDLPHFLADEDDGCVLTPFAPQSHSILPVVGDGLVSIPSEQNAADLLMHAIIMRMSKCAGNATLSNRLNLAT